ncbi:MAG TPA: AAA family ATPase [Thermomicrobiales bacterium]|nr:AAA family ATPase [Thermomicrobiales bacterium]
MARVILITGIMASGKSTVAQALAERLARSVHVRGDLFRRFIVNGREEMSPSPSPEAAAQLHLRYELGAETARRYHAAGFDVVYQDVILGPDLTRVAGMLSDLPLEVVVLCPSPEVVASREASRSKRGYGDWTVADLDTDFRDETPRIGYWLDTSELTVDETVDRILARRASSPAP